MDSKLGNLLADLPRRASMELFTELVASDSVRIVRIVSTGQANPPGFWYDQDTSEWFVLIAGSALFRLEGDAEPRVLRPGDFMNVPPHRRHRVEATDPNEPTVWLAIHYK